MKKFLFSVLTLMLLGLTYSSATAQSVMSPTDPDVIYTTANQPAAPAYGKISKWGHTNDLSWGPYANGYKSYYYNGMAFRLKFPKSYKAGVADGKVYPIYMFLHGVGETGTIYDNELQLLHGGQLHAQAVDDSTFDGFLIYPQSNSGYLQGYIPVMSALIDSVVKEVKGDPDRVILSGLSGGGQTTWEFMEVSTNVPKVTSIITISAAITGAIPYFPGFITVPVWESNGGEDTDPAPYTATQVADSFLVLGGNYKQSFYPTSGHDTWDSLWADPNYFNFLNTQHKANPLVYFQRTQFCPGQTVNVKLGLQPGFSAYQWEKNGVVITGATSNQYTVTAYGTYQARFKRTSTSNWSLWSPSPVVISQKQPTVTPPIQINGLHSSVLPAPDGSTTVPLSVPSTYASYEWHRVSGTDSIVSKTNTYTAPIGQYKVSVTEQFGCSSNFSPVYSVIAANGSNVPDKATNLTAVSLSNTSIELDWSNNPTPVNNETAFEIYRSTTSGSNYKMVGTVGTDVLTFVDQNVTPNTKYYYIVRAINNNGAAPLSNEASITSKSDTTPPTAPSNLIVTGTTRSTVSLSWTASTDDVGVYKYDIYINGVKVYSTSNTTFTTANLTALQTYSFYVKARDISGNVSPASGQVNATAALNGLSYTVYQGTWNNLPDFTTLAPFSAGVTPNVSLTPATNLGLSVNYGMMWQGSIIIPKTGTYTFETSSDDGSALYIGTYSASTTPLVNNDGLHGTQSATGKITLTAGIYPITVVYFQQGGGAAMNIYWTNTAGGIARQLIPNTAFADAVTAVAGPAKPSNFSVTATSYNRASLTWTDNSTNETGFEVSRAISRTGDYQALGTTGAGVTSFIDSVGLNPNTKYWYRIRSVNSNGASAYVSTLEGNWLFNNDLTDASGNNHSLSSGATAVYSADSKEGGLSISLDGTSTAYLDMPFSTGSAFPSNSYTTRTVSVWVKPTAATISGTNKVIYDFGGADNGLALRFNAGALQAGIASNNVRSSISVSSIATNANWVSNGWNNIIVVYNVNSLQLFVNGVSKGTASLSFSSVGSSTNLSRVGAYTGTNAFNVTTSPSNYAGLIDDLEIITEPLSIAGIASVMAQSYTADTTFVLPAAPVAPSNLTAQAVSPSQISLSFKDNSGTETGFQVYRSVTNTLSYKLLATVAPGSGIGATINYADTGLYPNTNYYYKVSAVGVGGNSAFTSPDVLAVTLDNKPAITKINGFAFRYGTQVSIPVAATDVDGDPITFTAINLPAFGTLGNVTNGATLTLSPAITDQGSYTISIVAHDNHSGTDTTTFTAIVNSNYVPVVTAVSNQSMNEADSLVIPLSATDQDGNSTLTWSLVGAPAFASVGATVNGAASLTLKPGYAASGSYNIVTTVNDGAGGIASDTFALTVINKSPASQKIYMDMRYSTPNAPAPWNNISAVSTNNLLDNNGQVTNVGLQFLGTPWDAGNASNATGNNSAVYPDAAIADYFWFGVFGAPNTVNVVLTGLSASPYNVTLFGSSNWTGAGPNGTTVYTINGVQKSIFIQSNLQNTVTFNGVTPDSLGNITVNLSVTAGTPYGVLNDIVLEKPFDDGSTPVLPVNLAATALSNGYAKLTWTNLAYNATSNAVYRATSAAGPYTLLNPGVSNAGDSSYVDSTVYGNTTYYYEIASLNAHGTSGQTAPVSVVTLDKTPVLTALNNVYIRAANTAVVNVTATDDPTNTLITTVTGLPAFATYQSTGSGTGKITIAPGLNDVGIYNGVVAKVTDNFGVSVSDTFNIDVTDSALRSVYVNFSLPLPGGVAQPAPWNNFLSYPFANTPLSNLVDDANSNTGFSVKLLDQWNGNFSFGMITGNNTGIVPDNVLQTSIETSTAGGHIVEIDGLNPAKKYNIGILSSNDAGVNDSLTIANGTQSIILNGAYNSNTMAFLNGLTPNAAGTIQVTLTKSTAASYLILNAMEIEEYSAATPIVRPFNLFAESLLDSGKVKLTWSDRSNNETGFQVYRATSPNGTYTLVTTTAANVTTYTNTGLSPNIRYFYKVRAINGASVSSNYTNIATVILSSKIVFINLNFTAAQNTAAPWNNTNGPSTAGTTFSNLLDNTGNNSGDEMIITEEFNGAGFGGVTTNGVFPGTVMSSNYWTDAGQTSGVKFDNLDLRKQYRIGIFGSAISTGYFLANYTCNGKTVQLNSLNNSTKIVYIDKLTPSADGELYLDVATVTGYPYSFTSAFTIESYTDTSTFVPVILSRPASTDTAVTATTVAASADNNIKVYPDPFNDKLTVELNNKETGNVALALYDANAQLVYKGALVKTAGNHTYNIQIPNAGKLATGSYIFNVVIDGKLSKSVVLIKVN